MSFKLGLTGSIGMGKSTTAGIFKANGVPVWDADAAVHRLYAPDGLATEAIAKIAPSAVGSHGVDRSKLRSAISEDETVLHAVEQAVHPLVGLDRLEFIGAHGDPILLFDIPLIYETGIASEFDAVAVVSTSVELQKARVLARPNMNAEAFELILSKQVPDAEKRSLADFVIDTTTMETAESDVARVLAEIRERIAHA